MARAQGRPGLLNPSGPWETGSSRNITSLPARGCRGSWSASTRMGKRRERSSQPHPGPPGSAAHLRPLHGRWGETGRREGGG